LTVDQQLTQRHGRRWVESNADLVSRSIQLIAQIRWRLSIRLASRCRRYGRLGSEAGAGQVDEQWIAAPISFVASNEMTNDVTNAPALAK
jgi:hypothetical protein